MNDKNIQNQTAAQKEWQTLKRIFKIYFILAALYYFIGFVFFKKNLNYFNLTSVIMLALFFSPLLLAFIYFIKLFYYAFRRNQRLVLLSLLVIFVGLLVGGGVCYVNFMTGVINI